MEEQRVLRQNQFVPLSIQINCEKIDKGCRITTTSPMDNFTKCPVIKEKGIPFSEHPMLRPFDKFLICGDPNIGKVTHIFILYQKINRPAMICSVVKTERRILIFPAWGIGSMKPLSKQNIKTISPIAHMTIEEDTKGNFSIHYTGSIEENGKKKKKYPKNKLNMKNANGLSIGTLGVNELTKLDPLGIVYRDLDDSELPRKNKKEIERIVKGALSPHHPLFKLPQKFIWDDKHHLEISFALIGNKLYNIKYPKDEIKPHEPHAIEQLNRIPLDDEKSLLITLTMCPGKLSSVFQWKRSKV